MTRDTGLSAHGAGVMQSVMMVRRAACVSADPGLAGHQWPSAQSCSDPGPGHMCCLLSLVQTLDTEDTGHASQPRHQLEDRVRRSRGCQRPETEAGLVTAAQM